MRAEKISVSKNIMAALEAGRIPDAVSRVERAVANWPDDADFRLLAGVVARQAGDLQNARVFMEQALQMKPDFPAAHHNLGVLFNQLGNTELAQAAFRKSIALDPENVESVLGLASALLAEDKLDETLESLQQVPGNMSREPRLVILLAETLRRRGNHADALTVLEDANHAHPGNPMILNQLGIANKLLGNLENAIVHYREALRRNPDYAQAWNNLGLALLAADDAKEAVTAFENALRVTPGWLEAQCNVATALNETGDKRAAVEAARHAVKLDGNSVIAQFNLAAIQSQNFTVEDLQEADSAASAAVSIDPGHAEAFNCKAQVLYKLGQLPAAETAAARAVALRPRNADFRVTQSEILVAMGDFSQAEQTLTEGLRFDAGHAEAHRQLGILRLKGNAAESALAELERALQLDPADQRGIAHKAIALQKLARREEARNLLGLDTLIKEYRMSCPPGYESLKAFNAKLAAEIENHPSLRYEPVGLAARGGSLAQDILHPTRPATAEFESFLRKSIASLQGSLQEDPAHPFLRSIPREFELNLWATLLISEGEISTHIHEGSWISGAYYVKLPPEVTKPTAGNEGYIEFGQPNYEYECEFERRIFRPEEGLLLLFPSYLYHRTIPFTSESTRISISFDLVPK